MLQLDDVKYRRLDLKDVIKRFRNEDDELTATVKVPTKKLKKFGMDWIPQLYKRVLRMCKKNEMSVPPLCFATIAQLIGYLNWRKSETTT